MLILHSYISHENGLTVANTEIRLKGSFKNVWGYHLFFLMFEILKDLHFSKNDKRTRRYTANVCRELQGLYREIGAQGFQIYGDCMHTRNPCNFEISTLLFPL